jgi:hypothetical protein
MDEITSFDNFLIFDPFSFKSKERDYDKNPTI